MSALPSSSSSLTRKRRREFTHNIFLSFHGKDTRKTFTSHLYKALEQRGIKVFRDDKSLKKGKNFATELLKAIGDSWGSIIVISESYAFSRWCLDELVEIMKQRKERGHRVHPIFYYVPPSDFRHQINKVKEAFDKHEERHNEEKRRGWRDALTEVANIHGWSLKKEYDEAVFIEDIVKDISKELDAETVLDEREVEKLKTNFQTIQAFLEDAENKLYMKEGETVKVWLDKLKDIAYDMDDVLDEWNTATFRSNIEKDQGLSEVPDLPLRIKELNEKYQSFARETDLFKIVRKKDDFPTGQNNSCTDHTLKPPQSISSIDKSSVFGRDKDKGTLISSLLKKGNSKGIPLLAIVGVGGLGKTTLAQLAFNDDKVKKHFYLRIWVSVSDPFDEVRIAKKILKELQGNSPNSNEMQSLSQEIRQYSKGKKFLLVLDDVWTEDENKWKPLERSLRVGSKESKILVTTRNEKVASILGCSRPFRLEVLSKSDSWSLFSKVAFIERSDVDRKTLESIGRGCVEKCAGLPLAIKTIANLLRFKRTREQWQSILNSHMWEQDEVEKVLFSSLFLSYFDLPSPSRQCFSYCAIFPKNHVIERDLLIKLWMAQGFLREKRGKKMEVVGEEYFDSLATRCFFQEFEKDASDDSIIVGYKMHDVVHEFAQLLRETECCVVTSSGIEELGADFCHENVRHLTILCDNERGIPDSTYAVKKLRSLHLNESRFYGTSTLEASLPKLFDRLTCLRMLNLSKNSIRELPQEIGKLIHLRYLSLEENKELPELPEALSDLCNLQTLNIRWCGKLQKLPHRMEKLISLRHLQNAGAQRITFMPKGMQRLTRLQTLEKFRVKKEGGIESETSSSLADLGKLIHLGGYMEIWGLGNVREASEAREARLSTKTGLRSLALRFDADDEERQTRIRIKKEALVLEALDPPQHLQELEIALCKSPALPSWITSLTLLKNIRFCMCDNWESLPLMGKLPFLESLVIEFIPKVKKVGEEFLGVETSSSSYVNRNIAFSSLKELEFYHMYGWQEWEYENVLRSTGGDDSSSSSSSSSSNISIMPKLQRLVIDNCPELKTLPRHFRRSTGTALQELVIKESPVLYRRFNKKTGKDKRSFSHIPTVRIFEGDDETSDDEDSSG